MTQVDFVRRPGGQRYRAGVGRGAKIQPAPAAASPALEPMMGITRLALWFVGGMAQRLGALASFATTAGSPRGSLPNFRGKVVVVYHAGSRDPYSSSAVVEARFERHGGRVFLCGEPAPGDTPRDWALGCRFCVAWEAVEAYLVFDSVKEYQDRCVRFRTTASVPGE